LISLFTPSFTRDAQLLLAQVHSSLQYLTQHPPRRCPLRAVRHRYARAARAQHRLRQAVYHGDHRRLLPHCLVDLLRACVARREPRARRVRAGPPPARPLYFLRRRRGEGGRRRGAADEPTPPRKRRRRECRVTWLAALLPPAPLPTRTLNLARGRACTATYHNRLNPTHHPTP
ncbi:hypothetical protein CERSUDRAFT_119397, partial [Gelatoporia subvermispora B]